jgi:HK97 family phage major capsid protein
MEVKELHEEMARTWNELKATLANQDAEIKKFGAASGETKTLIEKQNGRLDDLEKRIGAAEAKANRPDHLQRDPNGAEPSEVKAAFLQWARTGVITPEQSKLLSKPQPGEFKVLTVGDQTQAGYLAPMEYVREILKAVIEYSPVRTVARVRPTSSKAIQVPKRTGTFAAQWVAEMGTRSETTGLKYGLEEIAAHEMYALVDVSFAQLEDSAFNLEDELRAEFAEQFGVTEGTAFINGNNVGKPEGILFNTAMAYTASGNASAITADGLIGLFYDIKDSYARNATWLLKRATIKAIRQLKDTTNNYLWAPAAFGPGLAQGSPATIMDRPYIEALDMDDVAANKFPVVLGDFKRGYTILDRVDIAVIRDPYTQAGAGNIRFHARKRVGGQVTVVEALRRLKIAVS